MMLFQQLVELLQLLTGSMRKKKQVRPQSRDALRKARQVLFTPIASAELNWRWLGRLFWNRFSAVSWNTIGTCWMALFYFGFKTSPLRAHLIQTSPSAKTHTHKEVYLWTNEMFHYTRSSSIFRKKNCRRRTQNRNVNGRQIEFPDFVLWLCLSHCLLPLRRASSWRKCPTLNSIQISALAKHFNLILITFLNFI